MNKFYFPILLTFLFFICATKANSEAWENSYDLMFTECDEKNNEAACLSLLQKKSKDIDPSMIPINPKSATLKYKVGLQAFSMDNLALGYYLTFQSCAEGYEAACEELKKVQSNSYASSKNTDNHATNISKNMKDRPIYCYYNDNEAPSTGLGDMQRQPTGNPWVDIPVLIFDIYDTMAGAFHNHSFLCSYSDSGGLYQDIEFKNALDSGQLEYIIFFNGALKNYYKTYSTYEVKEITMFPKTSIEYVGIIDSQNNIIKLEKVKYGQLEPVTSEDWQKIKKFQADN